MRQAGYTRTDAKLRQRHRTSGTLPLEAYVVETASVEVRREDAKVTVIGTGALDLTNATSFRDELLAAAESSDEVVADLSGATFIDTAVLEYLARTARLLRHREKRLAVIVREDTHPVHVLRVVGFHAVMDIITMPAEDE